MRMERVFTGPVPTCAIPKGNCISYIFKDVQQWADRPALVDGYTGSTLTFAELLQQTGRWGSWLTRQCGSFVPKSRVVGILSIPTLDNAVMQLGTMAAGATFALLFNTYLPTELAKQLQECGPCLVVVMEEFEPLLRKAFEVTGKTLPVVIIGNSDQPIAGSFADIVNDESLPVMKPVELSGEEVMFLLYTSGSTGLPKCVAHSHRSIVSNVAMLMHHQWGPAVQITESHQERVLMIRDFGLGFGFICAFLPSLMTGVCQVVMKLNEQTLLQDMVKHKINHLYVLPPTVPTLLQIPTKMPQVLTHFNKLFISGSPLHDFQAQAVTTALPTVALHRCYGMSEGLVMSVDPGTGGKLGYTGQLLPNTQVKVVDVNTGEQLPHNQDGLLYFKTPCRMIEYLNNTEATAEILDAEGFLNSGDIGHVDEEGFLHIGDRVKEMIKVEFALGVSPSQLEGTILEHPGVRDVCVVGALLPMTGLDAIYAFVTKENPDECDGNRDNRDDKAEATEPGSQTGLVTEEIIKDVVRQKFNKSKHLGRVIFLETLPTNKNGKIDRKALKLRAQILQQDK